MSAYDKGQYMYVYKRSNYDLYYTSQRFIQHLFRHVYVGEETA